MNKKFKIEDINDIMAIWLNTNIKAHHFISEDYWIGNFDKVKEMLPTAEIEVYEKDGIKGFIGIMNGYIAGLFVLTTEQSKGIGGQLLEIAKERYSTLTLNVYEKNEQAIRFYEKHGFRRIHQAVDLSTGEIEISMIWEKNSGYVSCKSIK